MRSLAGGTYRGEEAGARLVLQSMDELS